MSPGSSLSEAVRGEPEPQLGGPAGRDNVKVVAEFEVIRGEAGWADDDGACPFVGDGGEEFGDVRAEPRLLGPSRALPTGPPTDEPAACRDEPRGLGEFVGIVVAQEDDPFRQAVRREHDLDLGRGSAAERGHGCGCATGEKLDEFRFGAPAFDERRGDAARRGPRPGPFEILADAAHGVVRREDEPDDRRDAGVGEFVDRRLDLRGRVLRAEGGAEMVGARSPRVPGRARPPAPRFSRRAARRHRSPSYRAWSSLAAGAGRAVGRGGCRCRRPRRRRGRSACRTPSRGRRSSSAHRSTPAAGCRVNELDHGARAPRGRSRAARRGRG